MATPFDDQAAAIKAAVAELKTTVAAKLAEKDQLLADAQKKLDAAAASAVSLDSLKAFSDGLLADIKGIMG